MERLSTLDVSNLRVEDRGLPMHVAALVILDGAGPGAGLDLDTVRTVIGQRLHLAPRLRQVLYWPRRGLGPPVWVDGAASRCGIPQRWRPGSAGWPGKPVSWHATDPPRGCH